MNDIWETIYHNLRRLTGNPYPGPDPRTAPRATAPAPQAVPTPEEIQVRENEYRKGLAREQDDYVLQLLAFARQHGFEALPDREREIVMRAMYDTHN